MYNQYNPFNGAKYGFTPPNSRPITQTPIYTNSYRAPSSSYQAPNQYRSAASFGQNLTRSFPGFANTFTQGSSFMNPGNLGNLGGISSMMRSPIGVPQSNGFIPKFGGVLGNLGGKGLGSKLGSLSWSKVFGGIQNTVTTVNQIMPLYQQMKPVINNGKTVFKMMRAAKAINKETSNTATDTTNTTTNSTTKQSANEVKDGIPANEVIDVTSTVLKQEEVKELTPKTTPNKPFFVE